MFHSEFFLQDRLHFICCRSLFFSTAEDFDRQDQFFSKLFSELPHSYDRGFHGWNLCVNLSNEPVFIMNEIVMLYSDTVLSLENCESSEWRVKWTLAEWVHHHHQKSHSWEVFVNQSLHLKTTGQWTGLGCEKNGTSLIHIFILPSLLCMSTITTIVADVFYNWPTFFTLSYFL